MPEPITFSTWNADTPLLQLLEEAAVAQLHSGRSFGLRLLPARAGFLPDTADIVIFMVPDSEALNPALAAARQLRAAMATQAQFLIQDSAMPDLDDKTAAAFHGIFKKPFRLAALLEEALSTHRLLQLRTPRQLTRTVRFNPATRMLENEAQPQAQQLSAREADFLLAVVAAGKEGLSREKAITEVWGFHRDVDSHAVETTVYRLRQKLQKFSGGEELLVSENGGYRWREG
jgi:DNA-binding response OmpR family regulator